MNVCFYNLRTGFKIPGSAQLDSFESDFKRLFLVLFCERVMDFFFFGSGFGLGLIGLGGLVASVLRLFLFSLFRVEVFCLLPLPLIDVCY